MKYLESLVFVLTPTIICFLAWTYIYNADFGLFIIPDIHGDFKDNWARFAQILSSTALGITCWGCKEDIKAHIGK